MGCLFVLDCLNIKLPFSVEHDCCTKQKNLQTEKLLVLPLRRKVFLVLGRLVRTCAHNFSWTKPESTWAAILVKAVLARFFAVFGLLPSFSACFLAAWYAEEVLRCRNELLQPPPSWGTGASFAATFAPMLFVAGFLLWDFAFAFGFEGFLVLLLLFTGSLGTSSSKAPFKIFCSSSSKSDKFPWWLSFFLGVWGSFPFSLLFERRLWRAASHIIRRNHQCTWTPPCQMCLCCFGNLCSNHGQRNITRAAVLLLQNFLENTRRRSCQSTTGRTWQFWRVRGVSCLWCLVWNYCKLLASWLHCFQMHER